MRPICINGMAFGAEKITGIERYVYLIIQNVDEMINDGDEVWLLCPLEKDIRFPKLKHIKIQRLKMKNKITQIIQVRKFVKSRNAVLFDMRGGLSVVKGCIGCIHDIRAMKFKSYDPLKTRMIAKMDLLLCKYLCKTIVTVSEFSKKEIIDKINVPPNRIKVIYSGCDYLKSIKEDNTFWERHPQIKKNGYYYSMGSKMKHKNYEWIYNNARNNRDKIFVIAGGGKLENKKLDNVIDLGYVSDEENKTLMTNCIAYLQPSKYEGFGLPPLEALSCGTDIMISDIPVFREIYKNCATFFDPDDYMYNFRKREIHRSDVEECLQAYSLKNAAREWFSLMKKA